MLRILLLEDNVNDIILTTNKLNKIDCVVIAVNNKTNFENKLKENFDLILLDDNIPNFSGREAMRIAKNIRPQIPLIFLTGSMSDEEAVKLLEDGADDYILKDRPSRLIFTVAKVRKDAILKEKLFEAQKSEIVTSLSAGIAHDVNNILTPIYAFLSLVYNKMHSDDEKKIYGIARKSIDHISSMVKNFLSFTKIPENNRETVDLRVFLTDVYDFVKATFPKTINIKLKLSEIGDYKIECNQTSLKRIILNLCINAKDAISGSGEIDLILRKALFNNFKPLTEYNTISGEYIVIDVRDNGCGIKSEDLNKIFELFYTTKNKGTGIGLPNSLSLIKEHNGYLTASSVYGQGSTFTIILPIKSKSIRKEEEVKAYNGNGKLILFVDDEHSLLELMKIALEEYNYKVLIASNGVDALKIFKDNIDDISTIIADVQMPLMDGITFINKIKELKNNLKVICITGSLDVDIAEFVVVRKPFRLNEILEVLK